MLLISILQELEFNTELTESNHQNIANILPGNCKVINTAFAEIVFQEVV